SSTPSTPTTPTPLSPFFLTSPTSPPTYTLSLHDALPISLPTLESCIPIPPINPPDALLAGFALTSPLRQRLLDSAQPPRRGRRGDRKSTRLNSSHLGISYAVFCLKKKTESARYRTPNTPH